MLRILVFIALMFIPSICFGETFYITATGQGDNECGIGVWTTTPNSLENAMTPKQFNNVNNWSVDIAADGKLGPGDDVLFYDDNGDFLDPLIPPKTMGKTVYINFLAGENETPVIDVGGLYSRAMYVNSRSYIIVDGLTFKGGTDDTVRLSATFVNLTHVTIKNCIFYPPVSGDASLRIYAGGHGVNNILIEDNTFMGDKYKDAVRFDFYHQSHSLDVIGNTFSGYFRAVRLHSTPGTLTPETRPYGVNIENNQMLDQAGPAIAVNSGIRSDTQSYIRNNVVVDPGDPDGSNINAFQLGWLSGVIIEGNRIDNLTTNACDGSGIIVDYAHTSNNELSDGNIIRYNVIENIAPECKGKGISVWKGSNNEVYHNLIKNCDYGIKLSNPESVGNSFHHNTIYGSLEDAIWIQGDAPPAIWEHNIICN